MTKLKENPELLHELESEIREISGAIRRMLASNLNRRAIEVLIKDSLGRSSKIGLNDVKTILNAVENLDTQYLRKKIRK